MAAGATMVLIADDDVPPPAATPVLVMPPPPTPMSAPEAERRLELRYRDTAPRAILVRLSPRWDLDSDVPDLATLKRWSRSHARSPLSNTATRFGPSVLRCRLGRFGAVSEFAMSRRSFAGGSDTAVVANRAGSCMAAA
jgi:hypothetical protein